MDIIQLIRIFTIFTNSGIFLVSGGVQSTGGSSYNALPGVDGGTQSPHHAAGPGSLPLGAIAVAATAAPPPLGPGVGAAEPASGPLGRLAPYFDAMTPRNVTALVGKSAYLSCRVRNLGNKTVSWIRHRDIHILTVGSYTYTTDQRFQANHHAETDEWTLQIKWAQKRDAGIYECQISTQPVRSYFVNLNVVDVLAREPYPSDIDNLAGYEDDIYHRMFADPVPTAAILGGPDIHVDKGSTINLTCSIRFSPEPPAYIFWYHHDDVISYDSSRGGVTVITEKGDVTTSVLLIQHAEISDSGKYSCSPSNADVASVRVYVLNGERPAAMQTGSAGLSNSSVSILTLMALLYLYTVVYTNLQLSSFARASPTITSAR